MRRVGIGVGVVAALVVVVVVAELVRGNGKPRQTVTVTVGDRPVQITSGTTLGAVAARVGEHPPAGNLLAVDGKVLRAEAFPGAFTVDGRPATMHTRLLAGDRVIAVAGRDRTEGLKRTVVPEPMGVPSNPQFFVDRVPGRWVIVRGSVSHRAGLVEVPADGCCPPAAGGGADLRRRPRRPSTRHASWPACEAARTRHVLRDRLSRTRVPEPRPPGGRMGMAIGNHSYNHPEVPPFDQLPLPLLRDEISLGADALARLGAADATLPAARRRHRSRLVDTAAALGQRVVLWSVDPTDWEPGITAKEIARRVLAGIRPGAIVDPARRRRRPFGHARGATGDRAWHPRARPPARGARARRRTDRGDKRGWWLGRHYEDMDIAAYVISGVISLAVVVVFYRVLFWAARKDGEKDIATQRKLGFRRKTRLGL